MVNLTRSRGRKHQEEAEVRSRTAGKEQPDGENGRLGEREWNSRQAARWGEWEKKRKGEEQPSMVIRSLETAEQPSLGNWVIG